MRYVGTVVVCSAIAVACDRPRDAGPVVQPETPAIGDGDTGTTSARPIATAEADTDIVVRPATPLPPPAPAPPTDVAAGADAAAQPATPVAPTVPGNVLVPPGYAVGPKPTELSHPEDAPPSAEPRADLSARVVLDAGQMRYELYATAPKPWVVKSETPFNLTLRPSNGVRLRKQVYDRRDFADPRAEVKQINAELEAGPGEHTIEAAAELYVCSAELCKRINQKLRTAFTIPKS